MASCAVLPLAPPQIVPLGDQALLVRFASQLSDQANRRAISFAHSLRQDTPQGVVEIASNLISVLIRYDCSCVAPGALAGEIRLRLSVLADAPIKRPVQHEIGVRFGGESGPDLEETAQLVSLSSEDFIATHNDAPLRVLATGFAPGFVYCGFHSEAMTLPRRTKIRPLVPAGSILFAAGQSAITATAIPTGWHVIGRTDFSNFNPLSEPPTLLHEGDTVTFKVLEP